jgi:hypothetical protein
MKLYHVSPIENEESITERGIWPNNTDMGTCAAGAGETLQGGGLMGIYGFVSIDHAIEFCELNLGVECNVIFVFDSGDCEVMADPEYTDNEAMFVITDEPIFGDKQ